MLDALRDLYPGQTAWIVGKGPSLSFLRAEHLGAGPIITINESILIVQDLGLSNPIYSMQKDGDAGIGHAVCPHKDIPVILQAPGYSQNDLPNHPLRLWMSPQEDFGYLHTEMSVRLCVGIAKLMGCARIVFVCCDSLVNGDLRRLDVGSKTIIKANAGAYLRIKSILLQDVKNIPHEFVLPRNTGNEDLAID